MPFRSLFGGHGIQLVGHLVFFGCLEAERPERYFVPFGYVGPVVIVYGEMGPKPDEYSFDIDESGVFCEPGPSNFGYTTPSRSRTYWKATDGVLLEIPDGHDRADIEIQVYRQIAFSRWSNSLEESWVKGKGFCIGAPSLKEECTLSDAVNLAAEKCVGSNELPALGSIGPSSHHRDRHQVSRVVPERAAVGGGQPPEQEHRLISTLRR